MKIRTFLLLIALSSLYSKNLTAGVSVQFRLGSWDDTVEKIKIPLSFPIKDLQHLKDTIAFHWDKERHKGNSKIINKITGNTILLLSDHMNFSITEIIYKLNKNIENNYNHKNEFYELRAYPKLGTWIKSFSGKKGTSYPMGILLKSLRDGPSQVVKQNSKAYRDKFETEIKQLVQYGK